LSKAALLGTPPANPNALRSPWQTRPEASPRNTRAGPASGRGKATVRHLPLAATPRTPRPASPKSARASPGSQLSVRRPSASPWSRSLAISSRRRLA
jgi:hypothetical protein